jgi:hypothetical protein
MCACCRARTLTPLDRSPPQRSLRWALAPRQPFPPFPGGAPENQGGALFNSALPQKVSMVFIDFFPYVRECYILCFGILQMLHGMICYVMQPRPTFQCPRALCFLKIIHVFLLHLASNCCLYSSRCCPPSHIRSCLSLKCFFAGCLSCLFTFCLTRDAPSCSEALGFCVSMSLAACLTPRSQQFRSLHSHNTCTVLVARAKHQPG